MQAGQARRTGLYCQPRYSKKQLLNGLQDQFKLTKYVDLCLNAVPVADDGLGAPRTHPIRKLRIDVTTV